MAISYPYLAILASIGFIIIVLSTLTFFIYTVDQLFRTPLLGVYAEAYVVNNSVVDIVITIEHKGGEPLSVKSITIFTDVGDIIIENLRSEGNVEVKGCKENRVPIGGVCKIFLRLPLNMFKEAEQYHGVVVLDKGVYTITFSPMELCSSVVNM